MVKKRTYTHRKDRLFPIEHGGVLDNMDHTLAGTGLSSYKSKKRNF